MSSSKTKTPLITKTLSGACSFFQHVTSFFYLIWKMLGLVVQGFVHPRKIFKLRHIAEQMLLTGLGSVPIVMLTSLLLGMTLAMLATYTLKDFGAEVWTAALVGVGFTRQLGPLITAIVVAGRVGASISAELGTMRVSEEIDALETMGINPVRFLVLPRFIALIIMMPCLTIVSDYIGMLGGFLVSLLKLNMNWPYYKELTLNALKIGDIVSGLIKSVSFGMIISLIGCYQGFIVQGGAEGVGRGTTQAVVNSLIFVIAADCFFTALFSYIIVY
ncbi:ABC transporter permease [bacterium]|nr:ABC transporter permease [bacterium]